MDFNDADQQRHDIDEIIRRLRETAEQWVPRHFPNGRREGDDWRLANIHGAAPRKHGSCTIALKGERAGNWFDHDTRDGGGPLSALEKATGLTGRALLAYAAREVGWWPVAPQRQAPAAPRRKDHKREIDFILSRSGPLPGTPAEIYLHSRGLAVPDCPDLLFHPDLTHWETRMGLPGLIGIVRGLAGDVTALHRTYLSDDGTGKADVPKAKKMLGPVAGGAVRLAPIGDNGRLGIAEGLETALAVTSACPDLPVWAALSAGGMEQVVLPAEVTSVVLLADRDKAGSKAAGVAAARLAMEGREASIAVPPRQGDDFNDLLLRDGAQAVRAAIDAAQPWMPPETLFEGTPLADGADSAPSGTQSPFRKRHIRLDIGSDVEIAGRVRRDLERSHGEIVHAEGAFWRYEATCWQPIADHELRLAVHVYDGASFMTPADVPSCVKLSKSRVDSVLSEMAALLARPVFFADMPAGINCMSGFIRFAKDGTAALEAHDREHRCRHTLPGRWASAADPTPPEGSLLHRLLSGMFLGDEDEADKIALLAEICGAAALGHATRLPQPRAVILKGARAENGKSQVLDLARSLLPASAVSSVTAARMGDERHIVGLVGKLLNASDELSSSAAIASDTFKAIVTGEPVQGRDVYKSRVEFRPVAQHLFATNTLPVFQGGMDRGVQRRLLVVPFNRVIPILILHWLMPYTIQPRHGSNMLL